MSPLTPLHDVNVTSIIQQHKNSHSNLLYKTNLCFDLWLERGRGIDVVFSLHTTRKVAQKDPIFPP